MCHLRVPVVSASGTSHPKQVIGSGRDHKPSLLAAFHEASLTAPTQIKRCLSASAPPASRVSVRETIAVTAPVAP